MEGANKLLLPWQKQCVLQVVVERVCEAGLGEVIVVTGHQRVEVEEALSSYPRAAGTQPRFRRGDGHLYQSGRGSGSRRDKDTSLP